uniref:Uncharacterized protein n=1 Tax=Chromera velia CCMP2878 TaxID=1169474 RepID=A0A0G4H900_9ALVE|eukprot:Cvel_5939.t1-p1 / transcript=Cvel_5939.t1 / gene=Cvel_5939 / organism=Chromera_velia_CCMP2878 / gene_product=hypothetical protein / transcript_product=hypothetical protein / location=Cvel_scaffold284:35404-37089(+) / protein_length=562 / sequence_SO=supercontig / SO=protein_coding / is_pseudo=false
MKDADAGDGGAMFGEHVATIRNAVAAFSTGMSSKAVQLHYEFFCTSLKTLETTHSATASEADVAMAAGQMKEVPTKVSNHKPSTETCLTAIQDHQMYLCETLFSMFTSERLLVPEVLLPTCYYVLAFTECERVCCLLSTTLSKMLLLEVAGIFSKLGQNTTSEAQYTNCIAERVRLLTFGYLRLTTAVQQMRKSEFALRHLLTACGYTPGMENMPQDSTEVQGASATLRTRLRTEALAKTENEQAVEDSMSTFAEQDDLLQRFASHLVFLSDTAELIQKSLSVYERQVNLQEQEASKDADIASEKTGGRRSRASARCVDSWMMLRKTLADFRATCEAKSAFDLKGPKSVGSLPLLSPGGDVGRTFASHHDDFSGPHLYRHPEYPPREEKSPALEERGRGDREKADAGTAAEGAHAADAAADIVIVSSSKGTSAVQSPRGGWRSGAAIPTARKPLLLLRSARHSALHDCEGVAGRLTPVQPIKSRQYLTSLLRSVQESVRMTLPSEIALPSRGLEGGNESYVRVPVPLVDSEEAGQSEACLEYLCRTLQGTLAATPQADGQGG